jgi:hypothetical protein
MEEGGWDSVWKGPQMEPLVSTVHFLVPPSSIDHTGPSGWPGRTCFRPVPRSTTAVTVPSGLGTGCMLSL